MNLISEISFLGVEKNVSLVHEKLKTLLDPARDHSFLSLPTMRTVVVVAAALLNTKSICMYVSVCILLL